MIRFLTTRAASLFRDVRGSAAVQFAVMLPFLFFMVTLGTDFSMSMVRSVMLERALDIEARNVRIGTRLASDYDGIREGICDRARIIPDCMRRLKLEVRAMPLDSFDPLDQYLDCVRLDELDIEDTPPSNFFVARQNQIVLVRACAIFRPITPLGGFAQVNMRRRAGEISDEQSRQFMGWKASDFNSYYQLASTTFFVKEP